jgi:polyisoprenoid-binding protein YceI
VKQVSICLTLLLLFTSFVFCDDFQISQIFPIETEHSYIGFSIKYMGFAKVRGRFTDFSGSIRYDEKSPLKSSTTVIIKVNSIDTDLDMRDKDLKSENWFDVEKFPLIAFQSKTILKNGDRYQMIGELTIKGVQKEVVLHIGEFSGIKNDSRKDTQIVATAVTTIARTDFNVQGKKWSLMKEGITAVDNEVEIELSVLGKQINEPNFRNWVSDMELPEGKLYYVASQNGVESALQEFEKMRAKRADSVTGETLKIVGYMLLKEGRINDAVTIFEHNMKCFPSEGNLHTSLGSAYAAKGNFSLARKHYQAVLDFDPANANAIEVLRHLPK